MSRPRFGVLLNGPTLSRWEALCLKHLLALPEAPILSLAVINAATQPSVSPTKKSLFQKVKEIGFNRLGYYYYCKKFFDVPMMTEESTEPFLKDAKVIHAVTRREGRYSEYFEDSDIQKIREEGLDFILRFGFNIIRGEILNSCRWGVWSFHHDDEEKYRGSPACFWEIVKGDPVTGALLQRLNHRLDAGGILKKGYFQTKKTSHSENLNAVLQETSYWPSEVYKEFLAIASKGHEPEIKLSHTTAPIYYSPNNREMLRYALITLKNKLVQRWKHWFERDIWSIAITEATPASFLKGEFPSVQYLAHPENNSYYADPFAVLAGDKIKVLCEEYSYSTQKGKIVSFDWDNPLAKTYPSFNQEGHLSYPYLISIGDVIHCIPETLDRKEVALYRAIQFPEKWEKVAVLVPNVRAVDSTLFQHGGYWWLAFTDEDRLSRSNLYLWYAPTPAGPFSPHLKNPVKTDIRSARPAGTPFTYQNHLYRPAQDCSKTYGGAIALNRVLKLTPDEFLEETVQFISPPRKGPFRNGIHTLSFAGGKTLLDGKKHVFVLEVFKQQFFGRIYSLLFRKPSNSLG